MSTSRSSSTFLSALYKGFFAEEVLSVTIDRGYDSAKAVSDVATGVFDMSFGDFSSLVEFKAKNPDERVKMCSYCSSKGSSFYRYAKGQGYRGSKELRREGARGIHRRCFQKTFSSICKNCWYKLTRFRESLWMYLESLYLLKVRLMLYQDSTIQYLVNTSVNDVIVFKYADYIPIDENYILSNNCFNRSHGDENR
uniref:Uncharacterized protein n=1 Tax=Ignisphaera aggregans TaxID=334771 RepID=A0A7J3MWU1_9CREN